MSWKLGHSSDGEQAPSAEESAGTRTPDGATEADLPASGTPGEPAAEDIDEPSAADAGEPSAADAGEPGLADAPAASGNSYAYADSGASSIPAQPSAPDVSATPDAPATADRFAATDATGPDATGPDATGPGATSPGDAAPEEGPLLADLPGLRDSWQRIQAGFVDDPREAVADAADLLEHTTQALIGALQQRQRLLRDMWDRGLSPGGSGPSASGQPAAGEAQDTEHLRLLMQRYRSLFNQLSRP